MDARNGSGEPVQQEVCYQFDGFRVCGYTRQLLKGEQPVAIEKRPFEALLYLIRNRHKAVPKAELESMVWAGRPVSETVLARCMMKVRHALGDDGDNQHYIRTVRGFGYQFCAEVTEETFGAGNDLNKGAANAGEDRDAGALSGWGMRRTLSVLLSVVAMVVGLAMLVFDLSPVDIPGWPGTGGAFMVAVQPVRSSEERDRAVAERLTMTMDRMLADLPRIESSPTSKAFADMESGFLPDDCLVLETRLRRYDGMYGLHYHLTVPKGAHLKGEFHGRNPRTLAVRVVAELENWVAARAGP